ncbi:hypothetical protein LINPERPRIM_LOCUS206 [Linum perenne]
MPRPGPRPYECVRRAWHSDRHQSMRGSIIQQIFRAVNENHSAATRKNKEWQEKLPIVVFKAEEIIYSKANSEEEYMRQDTLWDRVNEAINTIIRREEQTETGKLLPPCVEAALNLGCIPVRASRSQRHTSQRTYLSPRIHEPAQPARFLSDTSNAERSPQKPPFHSGHQNSMTAVDSSWLMAKEADPLSRFGTVYPLYYGDHYEHKEPQLVSQVADRAAPNTILLGKPVVSTSAGKPSEMGTLNFFAPSYETASSRTEYRDIHAHGSGTHCDLSLKLGFSSDQCMIWETSAAGHEAASRGRFNDPSLPNNQEFSFFPGNNSNSNSNSNSQLEFPSIKSKTYFSGNVEDGQSCCPPGFPSNPFIG